jgi:hypothetical protein
MAEKSFKSPIVGTMATLINVVPVSSAIDKMIAAEGHVLLPDPKGNPLYYEELVLNLTDPNFKWVGLFTYQPLMADLTSLRLLRFGVRKILW